LGEGILKITNIEKMKRSFPPRAFLFKTRAALLPLAFSLTFLLAALKSVRGLASPPSESRGAAQSAIDAGRKRGRAEQESRILHQPTPQARSFPDTTDGVYILNDQIAGLNSLTDAQILFAATHYVGTQKMTRRDTDRLRSINPNFLILHYRLGLALGYRAPSQSCQPAGGFLSIINGDWMQEWPGDQTVQEAWFYHYSGKRVYNCDWGWYLMDTNHPGWRQYWISQVIQQLQNNDNDGLFADSVSVPNALGAGRFNPNLPPIDLTFEADWRRRIEEWISYVKQQFGQRYRLIPNAGSWVTTRDQTDYSGADGVMIEGFSQWGPGSPFALEDWKLQMNRILGLVRQNKILLAQSYLHDPADIETRLFYLGNYLLIKGTRTYLNVELSQQPEWFPEFEIALGSYLREIPSQVDELLNPPGASMSGSMRTEWS